MSALTRPAIISALVGSAIMSALAGSAIIPALTGPAIMSALTGPAIQRLAMAISWLVVLAPEKGIRSAKAGANRDGLPCDEVPSALSVLAT